MSGGFRRCFRVLIYIIAVVCVLTPSLTQVATALSDGQVDIFKKHIFYYDSEICGTDSASTDDLTAGKGSPTGTAFPKLDPAAMADGINKYIQQTNPNSGFKDLGSTIVAGAEHSNVSPFLIIAIAQKESGIGDPNYGDGFNVREANNSFGRTATQSQPHVTGNYPWYKWSSIKASVDYNAAENKGASGGGDIASYLRNTYGHEIDTNDLTAIMKVYAPEFENDTAQYIKDVKSWIDKMVKLTGSGGSSPASSSSSSVSGVKFTASMTIDDDGIGPSHGDPYHQSTTSYANGQLNADKTNYIALAPGWAQSHGLQLGDIAVVQHKGKTAYAVYGDNFSGDQVHGEGSVHLSLALGGDAKNTLSAPVDYEVFPDSHKQLNGSVDQSKIDQIGTELSGNSPSPDTSSSSSNSSSSCCPDSGSSGAVGSLTGENNVEKAFNFFVQVGLSPEQSAGVVGNLYNESAVEPSTGGSPSAGAFGIAQWTPGSKFSLDKSFNHISGSDTDLLTQLNVLWAEMNGKSKAGFTDVVTGLKKISDPGEAADYFRANFERCDVSYSSCSDRAIVGKQIFAKYGSGAVSGSSSSGSCAATGSSDISAYKNPLRDIQANGSLFKRRIDEGVDYGGHGDIYAMGNGTVSFAGTGLWFANYGQSVVYKLSDGPAAGYSVYFSESCTPTVHAGQQVTPDTVICKMHGDNSPWTETGWAVGGSSAQDTPSAHIGYHECATVYGANYSDLLKKLGAPPGIIECGGPDETLPKDWPTW